MKRMILAGAMICGLLVAHASIGFAQIQPMNENPPAGVQPPWGHQLSVNNNDIQYSGCTIPMFFPDGHPGNPYDLIWHSWMKINQGYSGPATHASIRFILDLNTTNTYNLSCGNWWGDEEFGDTITNELICEQSEAGSSASLEMTWWNGTANAQAGFWCEIDD